MTLQKRDIDVSRVFLAFLSLQGDVKRTALACGMEESAVTALALQEHWADKLTSFAALREQDQNVQVQINRAMAFVQAAQLGSIIDGVIKVFSESQEKLLDLLTTTTKSGSTFSTKPITDLVKAAEIVQAMKARALGDVGAPIADETVSGASIGLNVARALNAVQEHPGVDAVTIVQKSLGQG